jgi:hypothetical protein
MSVQDELVLLNATFMEDIVTGRSDMLPHPPDMVPQPLEHLTSVTILTAAYPLMASAE